MDSIQKFRKDNVDCLKNLDFIDREYIIDLIEYAQYNEEILEKILSILRDYNNWYCVTHNLFALICSIKEFQKYTFYLLHKEYVKPEDILSDQLKQILKNNSWGLDYVIHNLERLLKDNSYDKIQIILEYCRERKEDYPLFTRKILSSSNQKTKEEFIRISITQHMPIDTKSIVSSMYQNSNDFYYHQECLPFYQEKMNLVLSELPGFLLHFIKYDKNIETMMLFYFDILIQVEAKRKMEIIDYFINELPSNVFQKYQPFFDLYQLRKSYYVDQVLSILINSNEKQFISNFLQNKKISYECPGSTTIVFKADNQVIKFTLKKHEMNTEKDLFLIAPTETKIIYDDKGNTILIIEIQQYLSKSHHNKDMSLLDVQNFLEELDKQGYIVTDPHCLNKTFDNFGFLNDYHDANITGFQSAEDLPEWFKERPIVLYDIDLVYKKDNEKKKVFGYMS